MEEVARAAPGQGKCPTDGSSALHGVDSVKDVLGILGDDEKLALLERRLRAGEGAQQGDDGALRFHDASGGQNSMHSASSSAKQPLQRSQDGEAVIVDEPKVQKKKRKVNKTPVRCGDRSQNGARPSLSPYLMGGGETNLSSERSPEGPQRTRDTITPKKNVQNNKIVRYFPSKSQGGASEQERTDTTNKEECAPSSSSVPAAAFPIGQETTSVRNLQAEANSLKYVAATNIGCRECLLLCDFFL